MAEARWDLLLSWKEGIRSKSNWLSMLLCELASVLPPPYPLHIGKLQLKPSQALSICSALA